MADKNFLRFTNLALKRAVNSDILTRVKGIGANGSFKLSIKNRSKKAVAMPKETREVNTKPAKNVAPSKKTAVKKVPKKKSSISKKTTARSVNGKKVSVKKVPIKKN